MQLSDTELVQRMKHGDKQAFEYLYDRYYGAIRKHLCGIVFDTDVVEDLVQEVFLRVWHKINQWKGKGSFKAWLYKIATNQALYFLRSNKKKNMESLNFAVTSPADAEGESFLLTDIISDETFPDPETLYAHKTRQEHLQQHIGSLSPEKREILQMIYQEDFSIKEASETLGVPEGTVKSRLFYAIKQLSEDMRRFLT